MSVRILTGDCRDVLKTLASDSVHTVVTSPPYFGLRDYGHAGQIGLEPTPDAFVAEMVAVFREVRRVMKCDATLWLNLGDSYASSPLKGGSGPGGKNGYGEAYARGLRRRGSGRADGVVSDDSPRNRDGVACDLPAKNLIGIPWRVAFALQAPDYLGTIRNETDRAWMAALIDGEGCISILETRSGREGPQSTSYPPILQVRMCDRECIDKAMALVGSTSENPAQYPPSMEGQRPAYQWRIHGRKAADTLAEIYPFLLIKRKQAIVAWNAQASREGYETKRGVKVPSENTEKQKLCREIIQKLNQRQPVDLPSWMIEPPLPVGPGWYLRQDVIWSKPNPMPESVTDRCTKAHEYLFLLTKSARYHFDADAIAETAIYSGLTGQDESGFKDAKTYNGKHSAHMKGTSRNDGDRWRLADGGVAPRGERNKRSVWTVATAPFADAHFATFPPDLIEPCIKAGCPEGGTVLDPFGGAGTTGLVADRLGRNAILIELNPEYAAMSERRIRGDQPMFADVSREVLT